MATIKTYEAAVSKKEDIATLLGLFDCIDEHEGHRGTRLEGTVLAELEATIFYPEGGGQPCDLGTIDGFPVVDVFEVKETGIIYHRIRIDDEKTLPAPGSTVHCALDWDRRLAHMQLHTAEHLLSGLTLKTWGGVNKGFHMGEDYATLDILFSSDTAIKEFTEEMVEQLECAANRIVWDNIEVTTHFCASADEASAHPLRKPLAVDEGITVVCIQEGDELYDCCACCGTHVPKTGSIGLVQILKAENYKGMTRITFTAGLPAFQNASLRQRVTDALCMRYSSDIEHLAERIDIQEQKNGSVRKELYDLKKDLLREEAEHLIHAWELDAVAENNPAAASIDVYRYERYAADDLQTLGHAVESSLARTAALVSEREHTIILLSPGDPHAGNLVKEYAPIYKGKGGGKAKLARAIFESGENLELFLDLIEKHLRP